MVARASSSVWGWAPSTMVSSATLSRSGLPNHASRIQRNRAGCGVTVEGDSVRGDPDDPFSQGHICPKAAAIPDIQNDPDRLRAPQRRLASGKWQSISWDEALDEAGWKLAEIQRKYGRNAIGLYLGNPSVHSYSAMLAVPLFSP